MVRPLCVLVSSIIPKRPNIWVFGAWFGNRISDNPKHFMDFINSSSDCSGVQTIWIYKDKKLATKAKNLNIKAFYHVSLKGIYYQLVAKYVFVTHSISADLNASLVGRGTIRVQMWHGVPLKKIMYDNPSESKWWKKNLIYRFITNNYYDYLLSPSPIFNDLFSQAFDMPLTKIIDTGYPRNDVFFKNEKSFTTSVITPKLYRVIYMPTYRKGDRSDELLFGPKKLFNVKSIQEKLKKENISLTIRVHPANSPSVELLAMIENVDNIRFSFADDIYDEISGFDCLVTDYSSIIFDFALTGKPIIFSAFDLESYLNDERSLYYSYSSLTDNQEVRNWNELVNKVVKTKNSTLRLEVSDFLMEMKMSLSIDARNQFSRKLFNELKSIK